MPQTKRVTLTHAYSDDVSVDIDISALTSHLKIISEERCAAELTFHLHDLTDESYANVIAREDVVTFEWEDDTIMTGIVDHWSTVRNGSESYHIITVYSKEVKIGWGDSGNRVVIDKYLDEIVSGYTDCVFYQNMATSSKVTIISSSSADVTQKAVVFGKAGKFHRNEDIYLNGDAEVEGTISFDEVYFVSITPACAGNITVTDESDNTLGIIPAGFYTIAERDKSDISDCDMYLDFREGIGTTAYDWSGNENNATVEGAPDWVSGGGIDVDGSTQYAHLVAPSTMDYDAHTVLAKITVDGSAGTFRAIVSPSSATWLHFQVNSSNKLEAWWAGPSVTATSSTTIEIGTEYNVAVTWGNGIGKMYINGELEDSTAYNATTPTTVDGHIYIGRGFSSGRYFNGKIKEVRIYHREFSQTEIIEAQTPTIIPNYATGILYPYQIYARYSEDPDYQIQRLPMYDESPWGCLERVCDLGDSNGVWMFTYDSGDSVLDLYPKSDSGTQHDYGDVSAEFENQQPDLNAVILVGANVKDSDGVPRSIIGYAYEDTTATTRIGRFQDVSLTTEEDVTQEAESILSEYGEMERRGYIELPLQPSIEPGDSIYVRDISTNTWGYERIKKVTHEFDNGVTYLEVGTIANKFLNVESLTDLRNTSVYGWTGGTEDERIDFYLTNFDHNLASSYAYRFYINVPESGILKAVLYVDGLAYQQSSAGTHTHDYGTYSAASHDHDNGSYSASSHGHSYGSYKDSSQTHSFSNVSTFAYKSHSHGLGSNGGTDEQDGSAFPHSHDALTGVTNTNTSGSGQLYYCSTSSINSSAAVLDSGTSGSQGASVSGSSGSRSASVGGSSGSGGAGATMAEDTYPNDLTITIDEVDRTVALGGDWGDGSNPFTIEVDVTAYVNTRGSHSIEFASSSNGRVAGYLKVIY